MRLCHWEIDIITCLAKMRAAALERAERKCNSIAPAPWKGAIAAGRCAFNEAWTSGAQGQHVKKKIDYYIGLIAHTWLWFRQHIYFNSPYKILLLPYYFVSPRQFAPRHMRWSKMPSRLTPFQNTSRGRIIYIRRTWKRSAHGDFLGLMLT